MPCALPAGTRQGLAEKWVGPTGCVSPDVACWHAADRVPGNPSRFSSSRFCAESTCICAWCSRWGCGRGACARAPKHTWDAAACLPAHCALRCRDYTCVTGQPSLDVLTRGQDLPPDACSCSGVGECAVVASSSFPAGSPPASTMISGQLAPVPFASLAGVPASELQCFNTSLAHASDNYKVGPASTSLLLTPPPGKHLPGSRPTEMCAVFGICPWLQGEPQLPPRCCLSSTQSVGHACSFKASLQQLVIACTACMAGLTLSSGQILLCCSYPVSALSMPDQS